MLCEKKGHGKNNKSDEKSKDAYCAKFLDRKKLLSVLIDLQKMISLIRI